MALNPPYPVIVDRERICLMGSSGSGKTRSWLSIAEMARKTRSDARFYVVDTDEAAHTMMWRGFPKLFEAGTVEVEVATDYREVYAALEKFLKVVKPGDWLIVDLMSKLWEMAQDFYVEEVYGEDKASFFLAKRQDMQEASKKNKNFQPFEGWLDWPVIKAQYTKLSNMAFLKHRGNVLVCTGAQPLNRGGMGGAGDPKDIIETFAHIGARPEGEKRMAHSLHTVMFMQQVSDSTWRMRTGKDREREYVNGVSLGPNDGQFVKKYLIDIAGWSLK